MEKLLQERLVKRNIMEVKAIARNIRVSPRKVRLIADAIRHLSNDNAVRVLEVTHKRAARPLIKVLQSAVANAVNNANLEKTSLKIANLQVAETQAYKRFHPSTRGRIHPYKKRGSTITVVLQSVSVAPTKAIVEKKEGGKK